MLPTELLKEPKDATFCVLPKYNAACSTRRVLLKYNAGGMYTTSVSIAIVWWLVPPIGVNSHVVTLNVTNHCVGEYKHSCFCFCSI